MAFAMSIGVGGLVVHLVPLFKDLGAQPMEAAKIASFLGLASVAGRIGVGMLLDRCPANFVAMGALLVAAAGALLLYGFGLKFASLAVMMLGLAAGAEVDRIAYLCSRQFGTRSYGAIYGWQYSIFVLDYGFSPYFVGLSRDAFESYDFALLGSMVAVGTAGLLALLLRLPATASTAAETSNELPAQAPQ